MATRTLQRVWKGENFLIPVIKIKRLKKSYGKRCAGLDQQVNSFNHWAPHTVWFYLQSQHTGPDNSHSLIYCNTQILIIIVPTIIKCVPTFSGSLYTTTVQVSPENQTGMEWLWMNGWEKPSIITLNDRRWITIKAYWLAEDTVDTLWYQRGTTLTEPDKSFSIMVYWVYWPKLTWQHRRHIH